MTEFPTLFLLFVLFFQKSAGMITEMVMVFLLIFLQIDHNRHSGSVVERPLCDREVAGSIPGWVIPKTLKMVLAAFSLGAQH